MSKTQLEHNMKIDGASAAKNILPALGLGALSGLASSGTQKALGNGLYLKQGGYVCKI